MKPKEFIGKITIQENIDSLEENIIPRTFVIDVPDPFEFYYQSPVRNNKPESIIFITKTPNSFEKVLRVTNNLNKSHNLNLDGGKCEVKIGNRILNGVRLKGIENYSDIASIQQHYANEGYDFAKAEKIVDQEAIIRINRFFRIEKIDKGIYKSKIKDDVYFVEVPKYMTWDTFREYTYDIKNNVQDRNYDIAKGIIYVNGGIIEILRIVNPRASIETLKLIQQKYIDKIN